jgi:hypothetical protein
MRENAVAKARRLAEGGVTITGVDGREVVALVRADSAERHRDGAWTDDCPARTKCSHVQAVMLVTTPRLHRPRICPRRNGRVSPSHRWEATAPPRTGSTKGDKR